MKSFLRNEKIVLAMFTAVLVIFIFFSSDVFAQCPMCKASVESNLKNNNGTNLVGAGLNNGILYLLAMPYILVGVIAFLWYRNSKKYQEAVK